MTTIRLLLITILTCCITIINAGGDDRGLVDHSHFVEKNPRYKKSVKVTIGDDAKKNDYNLDDIETDDTGDHEKTTKYDSVSNKKGVKGILEKSLQRTRSTTSHTLGFLKRYKTHITMALILYAFRRELWNTLVVFTTRPSVDGKGRAISLSPTSILKILLFLDLMRKLQSPTESQSDGSTSTFGPRASISHFFLQHLKGTQTAYIPPVEQHYTFERVNDRYIKDLLALRKATGIVSPLLPSTQPISTQPESNTTIILLDLKKMDQNQMEALNDEVSFLLSQHRLHILQHHNHQQQQGDCFSNSTIHNPLPAVQAQPSTEIVILLESPGGSASDFGLAASQLGRLRNEPMMRVTVCVDKVAASGGYMMACMASPGFLFAAPFAVVGSIGVLGQALNIHNTLLSWGVQSLVFRGGKDKAPVGLVGEVTKEGIDKVQDMIDRAHICFKRHVSEARPVLKDHLDKVTTGDVWLGYDAVEMGLIDRLITSDEYIGEKLTLGCKVLKLVKYERPRFIFGSPWQIPILPGASHHHISNDSNYFWKKSCLNAITKLKQFLESPQ